MSVTTKRRAAPGQGQCHGLEARYPNLLAFFQKQGSNQPADEPMLDSEQLSKLQEDGSNKENMSIAEHVLIQAL